MKDQKNDCTNGQDLAYAAQVAQFRFALIAPLIQGLATDASNTAYYKRITKEPLTLPNGQTVRYSWKTPQKWHSLYLKGGFDALMPKTRSDKGVSRSLTDTAIEEIFRLKEKYPRLNATQIHLRLVQDALIPACVSVDAVQRFIRHNDLKTGRAADAKDRKAFEEDAFGKMWHTEGVPCVGRHLPFLPYL